MHWRNGKGYAKPIPCNTARTHRTAVRRHGKKRQRREVKQLCSRELEKKGKRTYGCSAILPANNSPGQQPFEFFSSKRKPPGRASRKANGPWLFCRGKIRPADMPERPTDERPLEWISTLSPAAMKIGLATDRPHEYDLQTGNTGG